jgi:hypothetical protein
MMHLVRCKYFLTHHLCGFQIVEAALHSLSWETPALRQGLNFALIFLLLAKLPERGFALLLK